MSYQERRTLVSLIGTIAVNIGYLALMLPRQPSGDAYSPEVFRFWGGFFILLIGVSIIFEIILAIVFSILNTIATREPEPGITDERDKLIELKASRNGLYVFIIGFLLAMITLVLDMPPSTMFMVILIGGLGSQIIDQLSAFWFYRWGV